MAEIRVRLRHNVRPLYETSTKQRVGWKHLHLAHVRENSLHRVNRAAMAESAMLPCFAYAR